MLAAYIDGEGSIVIDRQPFHRKERKEHWSPHYVTHLAVTNTDPRLLVWCKSVFGGFITNMRLARVRPTSKRALYQWHVHSGDARWVLENCLPYFIIKRQQAEISLAMFETFPKVKYGKKGVPKEIIETRDRFCVELKRLKNTVPTFEDIGDKGSIQ